MKTFTKHYHDLNDIDKIYSDKFPDGKDLDLFHIVLYFHFLSYQENGLKCWESHKTLARIFKTSPSTIKRRIEDLRKMELVVSEEHPDPNIDSLIYTALPLTPEHTRQTSPEAPEEAPAPTMTKVIEEAVSVAESAPESVATATGSDQAVIDDDVIVEAVCERLSRPESLRQSQRYDKFTAYARRVLNSDGKRLPQRIEERLEERFEQLYPHLYARFDPIPF